MNTIPFKRRTRGFLVDLVKLLIVVLAFILLLPACSASDPAYLTVDEDDPLFAQIGASSNVNVNVLITSSNITSDIVNAKGDLISASANNTPLILSAGSAGQVLSVDAAEATGLKWITSASGQHAINSTAAHSSEATPGQLLQADANGLPVDASNTDAAVAWLVTNLTSGWKTTVDWLVTNVTAAWVSGVDNHTANMTNPHSVNSTQVGLGNVLDEAQIALSIVDAKGDIIAASGNNTPVRLAIGANTTVLTVDTDQATSLKWAAAGGHNQQHSINATADHTSGATPGQLLQADANGLPIDASNTDAAVAWLVTNLTAGWKTTVDNFLAIVDAKGDLMVATGDDTVVRVAVGTNDQVLTANSTASAGVSWVTPSASGGLSYTSLDGTDTTTAAGEGAGDGAWANWDLSAIVPAGTEVAIITVYKLGATDIVGVRQDGTAQARQFTLLKFGLWNIEVECSTTESYIIEIMSNDVSDADVFSVTGYWGS